MVQAMNNLSYCIKKAQTWADENDMEHNKLLNHSLAPDMLAFPKQIIILSNTAKFVLSRVAGLEVPTWEDDEETFEELQARLKKTIELLSSADAKAFANTEQKEVVFTAGPWEMKLTGMTYIQYWALPQFFFHVVTAYDILRSMGAPLGKADYIGGGTELPK